MEDGATPQRAEHRCRGCGCAIARDHAVLFCDPCRLSRRTYVPRHDPGFGDRLLELLRANPRRRLSIYRELNLPGCTPTWRCVRAHIQRLRRHGHVIAGFHDGTYEYRGQRVMRNARAGRRPRRAS